MRLFLVAWLALTGEAEAGKKKTAPASPAAAAEAPADAAAEVVLPCTWESGQVFHYEYERRRADARNPLLSRFTATTRVTVKVLEGGNPARFEYSAGEVVLEGPEESKEAVGKLLGAGAVMPPMRLGMTNGTVDTVENLDEIVEAALPILRAALPADAPAAVIEQTLSMFSDPVSGTALLLKEPGKLFAMHCSGGAPGEVIESTVEHPSPFGGAIPGHTRVEFAGHDADAGTLRIETADWVDEAALKAMLPGLMKQFVPSGMGTLPEAMMAEALKAMPPLDNTTKGTMIYATEDGFPMSVEVTQSFGAEGHPMHRTDSWAWRRVSE